MKELFAGMLLVFLNVKLDIGGHALDVLPDFVGYLLMMRGLEFLSGESRYFEKARPVSMGMAVYCLVLYGMDFMAASVQDRFMSYCIGLAGMICSLLIGFWIVSGIRDVEQSRKQDLEGEKLHGMWLYSAVVQGISYLCGWIPVVGQIAAIGAMVMYICFLVAFYRTMERYESNK